MTRKSVLSFFFAFWSEGDYHVFDEGKVVYTGTEEQCIAEAARLNSLPYEETSPCLKEIKCQDLEELLPA